MLSNDKEFHRQIHSIKRTSNGGKYFRYDAERNEKGHADSFWAWALANSAVVITDNKSLNFYAQRKQKKLEVDFVRNRGSNRIYIQSALSINERSKQEQEKKSLKNIDDSFKKIVVAKTGLNPMYDDDGILTIDLFDFLLDKSFLEG